MTQQTPQLPAVESRSAGRMTAVMRAIANRAGPRVLRIGVVHAGKVVEERVLAQRAHVTVGASEGCTFQLPASHLPASFTLFEVAGDGYRMNWIDGMTGRVAHEAGIQDLGALRAHARTVNVGALRAHQIAVGDLTRGKIVVGETTFLFQLVAPPPPRAKPQLPSSVQRGNGIDWPTTIIAAFSFLLHFGLVGSIYSDWMDPLLDDEARTAQLVESLRQLPAPPPVETPVEDATDAPVPTNAPTNAPQKVQANKAPSTRGDSGPKGDRPAVSDARAAAISNELASLDVAMVVALRSGGQSTDRILNGSDVPMAMLDDSAASERGVGRGDSAGLKMGQSGPGVVRPGDRPGLADIGHTGRGDAPVTQGRAQTTEGPKGNAAVGPPQPSGGTVANAAVIVAQMQAGFRRCYNRELPSNPDMKGSVRITAKIGPNGEVAGASAGSVNGLSGSLVACVTGRVASSQFAPPEGGGATIVIPVSFFPQ